MSAPTIIAGPAVIQFNGQSYYSEGDIAVNHKRETWNVATSAFGTIDTRLAAQMAEVSFKPVGALDVVTKYIPFAATAVGSLLINPASLKPVTIWAADGTKTVWANGFISKLPAFTLSATKMASTAWMMTVRINVAKSELTFSTSILPKIAVRAANNVESAAQKGHDVSTIRMVASQHWGKLFPAPDCSIPLATRP
jgi:hypothetical protein